MLRVENWKWRLLLLLAMGYLTLAAVEDEPLVIVGLAPLEQEIGTGIKAAVDLALQDVNNNRSILSKYNMTVRWVDTKCDMAIATRELFDLVHSGLAKTFVFGDYCSNVTKPMAETVSLFNLSQVSYADGDPTLSDHQTYRSFMRTVPSEIDLNTAIVSFVEHHNWTRVFTLFQDASTGVSTYSHTHNGLVTALEANNKINISSMESFAEDPDASLDRIFEKDGRIIIGFFDHQNARKVLCKAYHDEMYGYKFVWFLPSSYPANWWKDVSQTNCSLSQMEQALEGYFTVNIESLHVQETDEIINGKTIHDYGLRYKQRKGSNKNQYHGYAYDGIWLMALSLQRTIEHRHTINWTRVANERFVSEVANVQFTGVTGNVSFVDGNRQAHLIISQFREGTLRTVGSYSMADKTRNINDSMIFWHGHGVPKDRIQRQDEIQKPNIYIQTALITLAVLGQFIAIGFLAVNIKYRKTRYIKMSSPNMNNIIIVGCILVYVSVILLRMDITLVGEKTYQVICIARSWVLCFGFSLAFGAMFAKTWRVYNIFNAPHKQKKAIKDHLLAMLVIALIVLDLILLITWTSVDILKIKRIRLPAKEDEQVLVTPIIIQCDSKHMDIWAPLFYVYKGLLLVAGCWFAWNTRKVSIPALNDSKYIGLSVYNVVIMCASAVSISYILGDQPDHLHLIIGSLIILCTTTTLCLVFGPKVMHLRKGDHRPGHNRRPRVKLKVVKNKSSALERQRSNELETNVHNLEKNYNTDLLRLEKLNDLLTDDSLGHLSDTQLSDKLTEYSNIEVTKTTTVHSGDRNNGTPIGNTLVVPSNEGDEIADFREDAGVTTPLINPLITMSDQNNYNQVTTEILVSKQQLADILDMQQSTHL